MADNQYVGAKEAAEIHGMTVAGFSYHVRKGQAPIPAFQSGKQRFWTREAIRAWQPLRRSKADSPPPRAAK